MHTEKIPLPQENVLGIHKDKDLRFTKKKKIAIRNIIGTYVSFCLS